jgi:hypothetical protein
MTTTCAFEKPETAAKSGHADIGGRKCEQPVAGQLVVALVGLFAVASGAVAQPTYKLDVKPDLKPQATLRLDGSRIRRSAVTDDPGFRLQYHFKKDGKPLDTAEARSAPELDVPQKEPGTYTVVLELFYPAYKGGTAQKGEFRAVSNVLTYRVEAGAKPGDPVKVVLVEPPPPAVVIQCGKGKGTQQDEALAAGYAYELLQGTPFDGWPASAVRTHCWQDPKEVRFQLQLPSGTAGTLRLLLLDGDAQNRKQRVVVQGKSVGDFEAFAGAGRTVEVAIAAADAKDGKVEVAVQNLNPSGSAVVSTVWFVPQPK